MASYISRRRANASFLETCCDMATFALILYDYAITFDREVAFVWGTRFTGATALFMLNRYLALLKYPIYIVNQVPLSDERYLRLSVQYVTLTDIEAIFSCTIVSIYGMVAQILPYIVWAAFSSLRVYAICGQSWKAAFAVALPGSFLFASNIYLFSQNSTIGAVLSFLIATRSSTILSDALVIIITWWRTRGIRKTIAQTNIKVSLASLLLRDGTVYFMVLLVMNIFHIVFSLTGAKEPLTTILVSRFLLNLREADASRAIDDLDAMSRPSFVRGPNDADINTLRFATSFIAPLGAPLNHSSSVQGDDIGFATDVQQGVSWNVEGPDMIEAQDV
ncbi:hypothetical protein BC628DRAFT_1414807 [Trametes gibbosa]|nr:hypothetical protein BC628DRAFT_1414807 [Trametes gibbosa]